MFWFALLFVGAQIAMQFLAAKVKIPSAKLEDIDFPTATHGRIIPKQWGKSRIEGPNVIWYGDFSKKAITKSSGIFGGSQTVGYKYYVGMQMAICEGPVTLSKIWIGDKLVWEGSLSTETRFWIKGGGVKGYVTFYPGNSTQNVSTYLSTPQRDRRKLVSLLPLSIGWTYKDTFQDPCPAYRGTAHVVFEQGYIGKSPSVKPWSFEVQRIPTDLACTYPIVNSDDANPMEVGYEVLTNTRWGYASDGDISVNKAEFRSVADTLYSEGNGFSYTASSEMTGDELLAMIEKQIAGSFWQDPYTGQWRCTLVREDYSIGSLRSLDASNIKQVMDFQRSTWHGTPNSVRVKFRDRSLTDAYDWNYQPAQDQANILIQGQIVPLTIKLDGVKDKALASSIAWRELRAASYPLSKGRFVVDRSLHDTHKGEVLLFNFSHGKVVITDLPMRVTEVDFGTYDSQTITISVVQDVFNWTDSSFGVTSKTGTFIETDLIPFDEDEQLAIEAPYAISRRDELATEGRVLTSGQSTKQGESGYYIQQRNGSPPAGTYYDAGQSSDFVIMANLDSAIAQDDTTIDIIMVDPNNAGMATDTASDYDIGNNLYNLVKIGDEFVAFQSSTAITDGIRLSGCYRGMLDSAPTSHIEGETVTLLGKMPLMTTVVDPDTTVDVRLLPYDDEDEEVSTTDPDLVVMQVTTDYRERRPYPPTELEINSVLWPTSISIDSGVSLDFNRRDYRIYDELSQLGVDASTINGDFPSANTTEYAVKIYDGAVAVITGAWNGGAASITGPGRTKLIRYFDGLPTEMTVAVATKHVYSTVTYEALQETKAFVSVTSELTGEQYLGIIDTGQLSEQYTAPTTGTYAFSLEGAIASDLQVKVNGGTLTTVIAAGNTAGNLAGVTAGDIIEVRHTDSTTSDELLLRIDAPSSSDDAYAVLIFDNLYALASGGFGIGTFGSGLFGR